MNNVIYGQSIPIFMKVEQLYQDYKVVDSYFKSCINMHNRIIIISLRKL